MPLIKVKHILPYYKIHNLYTSKADKSDILVEMYNFLLSLGLHLDEDFDLYYIEEAFYEYTKDFLDSKVVATDIQRKAKMDEEERKNIFDSRLKEVYDTCDRLGLEYCKESYKILNPNKVNTPSEVVIELESKFNELRIEKQKAKMVALREKQISQKNNAIPSKFLELYTETEINVNNWIDMVRKDLNFNPYEILEYSYVDFIAHYNRMILRQESEDKLRKDQERKKNTPNGMPNFPQ